MYTSIHEVIMIREITNVMSYAGIRQENSAESFQGRLEVGERA